MTAAYLRFPHLAGDNLVFVADDDVWLAPAAGGAAHRLTADRVPVSRPRLSPDGDTVAWLSRRAGLPEVFAMPVTGGEPRQLSYFGSDRINVLGFDPAGRVVVSTAAGAELTSSRWAWAIDPRPDGDPAPVRLPYGPVAELAWSADGAVVVNTGLYREPAYWKRYRGGTAGRLWLDRSGSGEFVELLAELPGPKTSPVAVGDRIAFLADFEGHGNVYSVDLAGGDLRRHTDHERFYARQLTGDGSRLVYQHAGELWLLADLDPASQPRRLELSLAGARAGRQPVELAAGKHLGEYAVDRTGRASALEVRGSIVWLTHRDGPAPAIAATAGVRHRLPVLLGEADPVSGRRGVGYVTSAAGPDAIELLAPDGTIRQYGAGEIGRVLELAAAPDGSRLALACHDGRLLCLNTADGAITELARTPHGDIAGLSWSPDSTWLAFAEAQPTPGANSIRLCELATGDLVPVTRERFDDSEPVFSPDGKYLAFLSLRTFDPVYDAQVFDLSFAVGSRPFLVPLTADAPSPFDPEPAGRPAAPAAAEPVEQPPAVRIDRDGLTERAVPFPVRAGRYAGLRAVAGGFLWQDKPIAGELGDSRQPDDDIRPSLQFWDLAKREQVELAAHLDDARPSGDGSRLLVRDKQALRLVPAGRPVEKDDPERVEVDLDRIRLTVQPPAEWAQMFDETARLMRDHFWNPDLGGIDWDAEVDKYRPLLAAIATRDDLSDLLWEINGETGTSHCYEMPKPNPVEPALQPAYLGADLAPDPAGGWRVERVIAGDNSAREARSPLTAPAAGVRTGDRLTAVNGQPVGPYGPAPLLRGTAGKPVELRFERDGESRTVLVTPLADERELRYLDWVSSRRQAVHRAGDGRIGYLHVPDMMSAGWAAFHRDLQVEIGRDALIVDTRSNGGGHTSQLILEKLARTPVAWSVPRHRAMQGYPRNAPQGPMVSLCNEWAGSDGDIINASFKARGLGPVIGTRTWGGVVGIDSRYRLVDGTTVTQPRYAHWFQAYGWQVENYGVDPDVVVETPPQAWAAGADPVLQAGIDHLLAELRRRPAPARPDLASRPSLRAPALPPRP